MKNLYEYAIVRFIPDVERQEFVNIGLIMMCKRCRWIKMEIYVDKSKVDAMFPGSDIDFLHRQVSALIGVASGQAAFGPMALMEVEERFRWITAVKSACIQMSRPHPGLADDLDATFVDLLNRLVK